MNKKVLVIAAHADDDVLGCGATVAKHIANGASVKVVFLADGVTSRASETPESLTSRERAAQIALSILGVKEHYFCNLPDNSMDSLPLLEVIRTLQVAIGDFCPDVVYTHSPTDLNVDHRIAFAATLTVFRPQPGSPSPTILSFEIPSSTEWNPPSTGNVFSPNWFENVEGYFDVKLEALEAYGEEMRIFPHSRSIQAIEALATWRGSSIGVTKAEAFMLARRIQ
jgi:LmbE family N-acetylglucosaminyl deacetylase